MSAVVIDFVKDYALLSGLGVAVLSGLGWLLKTALSKPSIQQTQNVGPGGKGYQAGEKIEIRESDPS